MKTRIHKSLKENKDSSSTRTKSFSSKKRSYHDNSTKGCCLSNQLNRHRNLDKSIDNQKDSFDKPLFIMPKLEINPPGDKYEQEADQVADMIMTAPAKAAQKGCCNQPNGSDSQNQAAEKFLEQHKDKDKIYSWQLPIVTGFPKLTATYTIQQQCMACEEDKIQRQEKKEEDEELLHTQLLSKQSSSSTKSEAYQPIIVSPGIENGINNLRGQGQPLSKSTREFFEPRFGRDFSVVRVHNDSKAHELAQSINAKAFTRGNDIVFNQSKYSPESLEGKRLIAHELTHVIQQNQKSMIARTIMKKSQLEYSTERYYWRKNDTYEKIAQWYKNEYGIEVSIGKIKVWNKSSRGIKRDRRGSYIYLKIPHKLPNSKKSSAIKWNRIHCNWGYEALTTFIIRDVLRKKALFSKRKQLKKRSDKELFVAELIYQMQSKMYPKNPKRWTGKFSKDVSNLLENIAIRYALKNTFKAMSPLSGVNSEKFRLFVKRYSYLHRYDLPKKKDLRNSLMIIKQKLKKQQSLINGLNISRSKKNEIKRLTRMTEQDINKFYNLLNSTKIRDKHLKNMAAFSLLVVSDGFPPDDLLLIAAALGAVVVIMVYSTPENAVLQRDWIIILKGLERLEKKVKDIVNSTSKTNNAPDPEPDPEPDSEPGNKPHPYPIPGDKNCKALFNYKTCLEIQESRIYDRRTEIDARNAFVNERFQFIYDYRYDRVPDDETVEQVNERGKKALDEIKLAERKKPIKGPCTDNGVHFAVRYKSKEAKRLSKIEEEDKTRQNDFPYFAAVVSCPCCNEANMTDTRSGFFNKKEKRVQKYLPQYRGQDGEWHYILWYEADESRFSRNE